MEVARRPMFREGLRECVPMAIGISAWGLVAGVAMAKSSMGVPLAILMSLLVSAGSSQVAALPLIASDAPMWVVWATVMCVNLRFLVFSYQYRPYFAHLPRRRRVTLSYFMGDTIFAVFLRRFPDPKAEPGQEDFFWGTTRGGLRHHEHPGDPADHPGHGGRHAAVPILLPAARRRPAHATLAAGG